MVNYHNPGLIAPRSGQTGARLLLIRDYVARTVNTLRPAPHHLARVNRFPIKNIPPARPIQPNRNKNRPQFNYKNLDKEPSLLRSLVVSAGNWGLMWVRCASAPMGAFTAEPTSAPLPKPHVWSRNWKRIYSFMGDEGRPLSHLLFPFTPSGSTKQNFVLNVPHLRPRNVPDSRFQINSLHQLATMTLLARRGSSPGRCFMCV